MIFDPKHIYNDVRVSNIELKLATYASRRCVDRHEVRALCDMNKFYDFVMDALVFDLRCGIYGREIAEKTEIKYPSDWKESLKERFLPEWLKRKYPVKYTSYIPIFEELYPQFDPSLHDYSPVIRLKKYEVSSN